jgi:hypothetical protein
MTNDEVVTTMGWPPISGQTWLAPRRSYQWSNSAAPEQRQRQRQSLLFPCGYVSYFRITGDVEQQFWHAIRFSLGVYGRIQM